MAFNDDVEAIASDPNFEIITTFAYSVGLPHNEASLPGSNCYLLQHSVDRLQSAATDLSWTATVENLLSIGCVQSLSKEISAHMLLTHGEASKDPSRRFIVRLAFKKDGMHSIMSGPRPSSTDPLYPVTLPNIINPLILSTMPVYLDTEPTTPSLLTKHKTTHRGPYSAAWKRVGLDETTSPAECDVLLQNEDGHIMGAAFRTVYFWKDGRFVTPSSVTGCKMGVSRRWAV
ncbi:hypothetical protein LY78DRAFT_663025 [Colletotrichum sublineola]|uniref:Putative aminodeoxychorismate lyase n=1 Tax=Colletotrichum sublineola TaxID=1173701 RepID=A0A066XLJ4_COLSU|nr:hypothetical protein LY78DRAFT_663025 [Colletotrichum sublineola]KDN68529.1 putative aminodeoxychorismate lyase [Colletotrichum sublineola]